MALSCGCMAQTIGITPILMSNGDTIWNVPFTSDELDAINYSLLSLEGCGKNVDSISSELQKLVMVTDQRTDSLRDCLSVSHINDSLIASYRMELFSKTITLSEYIDKIDRQAVTEKETSKTIIGLRILSTCSISFGIGTILYYSLVK